MIELIEMIDTEIFDTPVRLSTGDLFVECGEGWRRRDEAFVDREAEQ
ncbi:hypothetical protein GCM10009422_29990 [Brevundimonas kwangchunensis]|uniref:Uncharacterized protein n=1 Tax=Brevundimonas kwangchunensis TaxID=322163 RepID=A0ABN1H6J3_9CAUL